jgi:hypothetical protein
LNKDSFAYLCAVLLLISSVAILIALPSTANAQSNDPILEGADYNSTSTIQYPQGLPSISIQRIIIEYADTTFQVDMKAPQGLPQPDAPRIIIEYADCALTVDVALYLGPQPTGENDTRPPEIGVPVRVPAGDVLADQSVTVSVDIADVDGGVKDAILQYNLNNGPEWVGVPMTLNLSGYKNSLSVSYYASIPGQSVSTWVRFRIIAYDFAEHSASRDGESPYCPYQVIPEFPSITLMLVLAISSLSATALAKNIHRRRSRIAI